MNSELEQIICSMIANAGEARSFVFEALQAAKEKKFEEARGLIKKSRELSVDAHKQQIELLSKEARGENFEASVLLIHAEDLLMATMTERDLGGFIIDLFEELNQLKSKP